jgi:hypothetical protein
MYINKSQVLYTQSVYELPLPVRRDCASTVLLSCGDDDGRCILDESSSKRRPCNARSFAYITRSSSRPWSERARKRLYEWTVRIIRRFDVSFHMITHAHFFAPVFRNADAVVITLELVCQRMVCQAYHVVKREESNRRHQSFPIQKVDVCGCSLSNRCHQVSLMTFLSFLQKCIIWKKKRTTCYFGPRILDRVYRVRFQYYCVTLGFSNPILLSAHVYDRFLKVYIPNVTTIPWDNLLLSRRTGFRSLQSLLASSYSFLDIMARLFCMDQ